MGQSTGKSIQRRQWVYCRVSSSHTLQPEGTSGERKARSMATEKSKAHEGFLTLLTNHGYSSFLGLNYFQFRTCYTLPPFQACTHHEFRGAIMSALLGWPNLSFLRFCHCVFLGLWDLRHIPPNTYMFSGWLRTQSATGYLLKGIPLDMRVILPAGSIENWLSIRFSLVATNEPMNSLFKIF